MSVGQKEYLKSRARAFHEYDSMTIKPKCKCGTELSFDENCAGEKCVTCKIAELRGQL